MTTSITIPKTIEAAKAALGAVGALLTAKNWERAAIVYAFAESKEQGSTAGNTAVKMSFTAFAALKIVGLTDRETVADYHRAWQWAIDNGMASEVKPGDEVTLPTAAWPPGIIGGETGEQMRERVVRTAIKQNPEKVIKELVEKNPESFRKAMAPGSESRETLVEAVADMSSVADEVTQRVAEKRAANPVHRNPRTPDRVVTVVTDALNEFWSREVWAGPNRITFQQVVETVLQNRNSATLRSRVAPTVMVDVELLDALAKHISKSEDIRDGKTITTTGKSLVGGGQP